MLTIFNIGHYFPSPIKNDITYFCMDYFFFDIWKLYIWTKNPNKILLLAHFQVPQIFNFRFNLKISLKIKLHEILTCIRIKYTEVGNFRSNLLCLIYSNSFFYSWSGTCLFYSSQVVTCDKSWNSIRLDIIDLKY